MEKLKQKQKIFGKEIKQKYQKQKNEILNQKQILLKSQENTGKIRNGIKNYFLQKQCVQVKVMMEDIKGEEYVATKIQNKINIISDDEKKEVENIVCKKEQPSFIENDEPEPVSYDVIDPLVDEYEKEKQQNNTKAAKSLEIKSFTQSQNKKSTIKDTAKIPEQNSFENQLDVHLSKQTFTIKEIKQIQGESQNKNNDNNPQNTNNKHIKCVESENEQTSLHDLDYEMEKLKKFQDYINTSTVDVKYFSTKKPTSLTFDDIDDDDINGNNNIKLECDKIMEEKSNSNDSNESSTQSPNKNSNSLENLTKLNTNHKVKNKEKTKQNAKPKSQNKNTKNNQFLQDAFSKNRYDAITFIKCGELHEPFIPQPMVDYSEAVNMLLNDNCCFGLYDKNVKQWRTAVIVKKCDDSQTLIVRFCHQPRAIIYVINQFNVRQTPSDADNFSCIKHFPVDYIINDRKRFYVTLTDLRCYSQLPQENIDAWNKINNNKRYESKMEGLEPIIIDVNGEENKTFAMEYNDLESDIDTITNHYDGIENDNDFAIFHHRAERIFCALLRIEQYSMINKETENILSNNMRSIQCTEEMEKKQDWCLEMDKLHRVNAKMTQLTVKQWIIGVRKEYIGKLLHLQVNDLHLDKLDTERKQQTASKGKEFNEKCMKQVFRPQNKKRRVEYERIIGALDRLRTMNPFDHFLLFKSNQNNMNDIAGLKNANIELRNLVEGRKWQIRMASQRNKHMRDRIMINEYHRREHIIHEMNCSNKVYDELKEHNSFIIDRKNIQNFRRTKPLQRFEKYKKFEINGLKFKVGLFPNGKTQFDAGSVQFVVKLVRIPMNIKSVVIYIKLYCDKTDTVYKVTKTFYNDEADQCKVYWHSHLSFAHCKQYNYIVFEYDVEILQINCLEDGNPDKMITNDYTNIKFGFHKVHYCWPFEKKMLFTIRHSKKGNVFYTETLHDSICFSLISIGKNVNVSLNWLKFQAKTQKYHVTFSCVIQNQKLKYQQRKDYEIDYNSTQCTMKLNKNQVKMIFSSQYKELHCALAVFINKQWVRDCPKTPIENCHKGKKCVRKFCKSLAKLHKQCPHKHNDESKDIPSTTDKKPTCTCHCH